MATLYILGFLNLAVIRKFTDHKAGSGFTKYNLTFICEDIDSISFRTIDVSENLCSVTFM